MTRVRVLQALGSEPMSTSPDSETIPRRPWRLWPGVAAAILLVVTRFVVPAVVSGAMLFGVLGAATGTLAILVWWLFFSRAPWSERLGAIAVMVVALIGTHPLLDRSIAGGGMGVLFYLLAVPVQSLALVAWAAASCRLADGPRRAALVATLLLASGAFTLVRTAGITGEGGSDLHWRWSATPEER